MTDDKLSRRQLLQTAIAGLAAVPAASLLAGNAGAETLSESDATAKSLGYVADAKKADAKANPNYKAGQHCGNCMTRSREKSSAKSTANRACRRPPPTARASRRSRRRSTSCARRRIHRRTS